MHLDGTALRQKRRQLLAVANPPSLYNLEQDGHRFVVELVGPLRPALARQQSWQAFALEHRLSDAYSAEVGHRSGEVGQRGSEAIISFPSPRFCRDAIPFEVGHDSAGKWGAITEHVGHDSAEVATASGRPATGQIIAGGDDSEGAASAAGTDLRFVTSAFPSPPRCAARGPSSWPKCGAGQPHRLRSEVRQAGDRQPRLTVQYGDVLASAPQPDGPAQSVQAHATQA